MPDPCTMLRAADDAVTKLGKATGHPQRLAALAIDISDPKSIDAAAQTLERDFAGKLGGLINNAAVRFQSSLPCPVQSVAGCEFCRPVCACAALLRVSSQPIIAARTGLCGDALQQGHDSSMRFCAQVITGEVTEEEYNRLWATNMAGSFGLSKRLATVINEGALSAGNAMQPIRSQCSTPCFLLNGMPQRHTSQGLSPTRTYRRVKPCPRERPHRLISPRCTQAATSCTSPACWGSWTASSCPA